MKATLTRLETSDAGSFGQLDFRGDLDQHILFSCKTGELPWRENAVGKSCIPAGSYKVALTNSPKFGPDTYEIQNVPGRTHVLIHAGNHCGDTAKGYASDVEGCTLVGKEVVKLLNGDKKMQMGVTASRDTLKALKAFTQGAPFDLDVKDVVIAPDSTGDMA